MANSFSSQLLCEVLLGGRELFSLKAMSSTNRLVDTTAGYDQVYLPYPHLFGYGGVEKQDQAPLFRVNPHKLQQDAVYAHPLRSEEHTSELQSR